MAAALATSALGRDRSPIGRRTTIVEPGFFRTALLEKESTTYAELSIDDYAERTAQTRPAWEAIERQAGR